MSKKIPLICFEKRVIIAVLLFVCSFLLFAEEVHDFENSLFRQTSYISYAQNEEYRNKESIPCVIKSSLTKEELEQKGIYIESNLGNIFTARIDPENIIGYKKINGIDNIYFLPPDKPLLDVTTSDDKTGSDYLGCDADYLQSIGLDGDGVIVGILDYYPLNWKHEDFNETGWNTSDLRVINIWNQNDNSGTPPTGFGYGTEYSKSDLMSDNGPVINSGNHGTQCTGIAAGDGSGSGAGNPYKGMAPGAEIIYVHKIWHSENTIDAFSYFSQKADDLGKPIIVSFSGGSFNGITDGSDPVSIAINNFCESGKMASVAVGNYYSYEHVQSTTTYGSPTNDITLKIDSYTDSGSGQFDDYLNASFYFKSGDNFDVTVTGPGLTSYEKTVIEEDEVHDTAYGRLYILHDSYPSIEVVITDEVGTVTVGDVWTIAFECPGDTYDDQGGKWSGWLNQRNITGDFTNYETTENTLNVYASGTECLGVGAYSKTTGSIYGGSSAGLTFDNRIKPDICTPTSANTTTNSGPSTYGTLGATSGAAPHASGMVALLFQLYPDLEPSDIISYFTDSGWSDTDTDVYGSLPNNRFGYGKMNCPGIYEQTASADVTQSVSVNEITYSFDSGAETGIDMIFHGLSSAEDINVKKYSTTPHDCDISDANVSDYRWVIDGSGFTSVDLYFDVNELAGVTDANTVNIYQRSSEGSGTFGSALSKTVSGSEIIVTATSFSEFALGSDDLDNPLPVTLSHFSVSFNDLNNPKLNWTTASEQDNAFWNVYRSISENFGQSTKINEEVINGKGTTSIPSEYQYVDSNDLTSQFIYWYWIESVTISGATDLYGPISLYISDEFENPQTPQIQNMLGLFPNYPNPFNPETVISFAIDKTDYVELNIFNLKGQVVKKLASEEFTEGIHYISWNGLEENGKPVPSGIYLYKILTSSYSETRKMLLLK